MIDRWHQDRTHHADHRHDNNNNNRSILSTLRTAIGRSRQLCVLTKRFLVRLSILISFINMVFLIYDTTMYLTTATSFATTDTWYVMMVYSSSLSLVSGMLGFVYSAVTQNTLYKRLAGVSLLFNLALMLLRFTLELLLSGFRPMFINEPGD